VLERLFTKSVKYSAQQRTRVPMRKNLMRPASRARKRVMRAMSKRFAVCFVESKCLTGVMDYSVPCW
jgi:hypothetical protein